MSEKVNRCCFCCIINIIRWPDTWPDHRPRRWGTNSIGVVAFMQQRMRPTGNCILARFDRLFTFLFTFLPFTCPRSRGHLRCFYIINEISHIGYQLWV